MYVYMQSDQKEYEVGFFDPVGKWITQSTTQSVKVAKELVAYLNSDQSDILAEKEREIEFLQDKLDKIKDWCNAYPVKIFGEPDFEKAARVLKENGMTIDSISASNMRHVLDGVAKIIKSEL